MNHTGPFAVNSNERLNLEMECPSKTTNCTKFIKQIMNTIHLEWMNEWMNDNLHCAYNNNKIRAKICMFTAHRLGKRKLTASHRKKHNKLSTHTQNETTWPFCCQSHWTIELVVINLRHSTTGNRPTVCIISKRAGNVAFYNISGRLPRAEGGSVFKGPAIAYAKLTTRS